MNNVDLDGVQLVVRFIINAIAGGMITAGHGDKEYWQQALAAATVVTTLCWSVLNRRQRNKRNNKNKQRRR